MFFKKNTSRLNLSRPKSNVFTYKREIIGIFLITLFTILALSLFSYHPTDQSWFYYSSEPASVKNWIGSVGAYVSAFFFYLFGSSAYICIFILLFLAFIIIFRRNFRQEYDRILAIVLLLLTFSTLFRAFFLDFTNSYPGGLLGDSLYKIFISFFGSLGTKILLFAIVWVGVVIFCRVSIFKALKKTLVFLYKVIKIVFVFIFRFLKLLFLKFWHWILCKLSLLWLKLRRKKKIDVDGSGGSSVGGEYKKDENNEKQKQFSTNNNPFWKSMKDIAQQVNNDLDDNVYNYSKGEVAVFDDIERKDYLETENLMQLSKRFYEKPVFTQSYYQNLGEYKIPFLPNSCINKNIFAQDSFINELCEHIKLSKDQQQRGRIKKHIAKIKYNLPNVNIFEDTQPKNVSDNHMEEESRIRAEKLEEKLEHFGIQGKVVAIRPGPVITLFEYKPDIGSKISKIISLEDDLAMALQAISIRIVAPIPGRSVVGFEISNQTRHNVYLSDVLLSKEYEGFEGNLSLTLGVDIVGRPVVEDLVSMPHLLVAGSTGAGKSVGLNVMLISLLCKMRPDQLKLILIDPKRLEFAPWADIPHLLFPIVTNPRKAAPILKWLVQQMEDRYDKMAQAGVRNIVEYQKLYKKQIKKGIGDKGEYENMPFIILMIDELADLMMVAGKDIETQIARIAQMARAAGIHMIVATQRPSVDVVTGIIKVNFPSRISYRVSSKIDSRTIVDSQGAEKLLGKGDLLYMNSVSSDLKRIHGAFVSDKEIGMLTKHLKEQGEPCYLDLHETLRNMSRKELENFEDELYPQILEFLKGRDEISISMLQRYYRIGFNRSAKIIERLEFDGVIAPAQGSKPRRVIIE
ncbi:DNA translocase FtsK [Candidatus Babeliales bacterium]|nr:DNA translocase FtsK [Candidatus Babeliales bacterium]